MFDQPPQRLSAKDMSVGPILSDLPHHELFQKGCSELRTTIRNNAWNSARRSERSTRHRLVAYIGEEQLVTEKAKAEGKNTYIDNKQSSWSSFVLHDVQSVVAMIPGTNMICEYYREKRPDLYTEEIKQYEEKIKVFTPDYSVTSNKPLTARIDEDFSGLVTLYKDSRKLLAQSETMDPYFKKLLDKIDNYVKMAPLLESSSHFLLSISENNKQEMMMHFGKLQKMDIPLRDIFNLSNQRIKPETMVTYGDVRVDGVTAIMVHNLLKNAQRHSTSYVDIAIGQDGIVISNDTRTVPDENKLFQPEKPQAGGNKGYGLFTAKKIFGPLAGKDIEYKNGDSGKSEPPYEVSFTIKPLDNEQHIEKNELPTLEANKGYEEFRQNYALVEGMKTAQSIETKNQDWHKFIFHDVQTPATLYAHFVYGEESALLKSFFNRYNNAKDPRIKVLLLSQMNKQKLLPNNNFPKEYLEGIQIKLERFRTIFPLLRGSMDFLINPTNDSYQALVRTSVPVQDIINAFAPEMSTSDFSGVSVNGFEGIALLNFLKNAREHCPYIDEKIAEKGRDYSSMRLKIDDEGFTVINDSNNGKPEKLFQLKGKGESGNNGFGMFTAAKLYSPLVGRYAEAEWTDLPNENGPKYSVRFSLKKSPQSDNGSPLPPPVQ